MTITSPRLSKRKLFLVLFFISLLAYSFWTGSRYPALNDKALMGGDMNITGIGFDIAYEVFPDDSLPVTIGKTTLNWIKTNLKGMTFGILFASLFLILFSWVNKLEFKNKFIQSFFGLFIGAPLGVCVNCAAPIAFGARKANLSVISSLSMMMSSPTFNFVILTMLFTMFHPYVALLKIASAALLILIGVPIIAKFGEKNVVISDNTNNTQLSFLSEDQRIYEEESFFKTCQWFVIQFAKALFFILKKTLPLMLLAGLLGSVFISLMDWDSIFSLSQLMTPQQSIKIILLVLAAFALIGTFLPVPIAFDVIVVAILLNLGISYSIASTLLFTLGIFSIYSFFIVKKAINLKTALLLFSAVAFVGFLNGLMGLYFDRHLVPSDKEMIAYLKDYNGEFYKVEGKINDPKVYDFESVLIEPSHIKTSNAMISESRFNEKKSGTFEFTLHNGPDIGINRNYEFTTYDTIHAGFNMDHGFSSSGIDYNDDGWVDLIFGSPIGLQRFKNQGGKGFIKEPFGIEKIDSEHIVIGHVIDLNNDGFKDVIASVLTDGLYVFYGSINGYREDNFTKVNFPNRYLTSRSISFHDIDLDGDLDIFCGNWSMGKGEGNISYKSSSDYFIINHIDSLKLENTNYPQGATLTSMFWDKDGNSKKELFIGIDFEQPDWSISDFSLDKSFDKNNIPYTTTTTMSVSAADINNDLKQDLYIAQIAEKPLLGDDMIKDVDQICDCFKDTPYMDECQRIVEGRQNTRQAIATGNFKLLPQKQKASAYKTFLLAEINRKKSQAKSISEELEEYASKLGLWNYVHDSSNIYASYYNKNMMSSKYLRQKEDLNLLFLNEGDELVDNTKAFRLNKGGWTWNAQFEDLNNDEFVDLFLVNGSGRLAANQPSFFYLNKNGKIFEEAGKKVGLRNYLSSQSYTYIDYDNDGDMDIAVLPEGGPVLLFENNLNNGRSIQFELNSKNNMSAIVGAKVYIYYGDNKTSHQMREIRQSGGYQSYNPTSVHFGLGEYQQINKAVVVWNNGDSTVVDEPLKAGYKYWIDKTSK
jgi:uncharacterized membrane protein YraQ (UPF0718 family)